MSNPDSSNRFVRDAMEASIKIGAVFILIAWCYDILKPFIVPLIWAAIIAVAIKPLSDLLEKRFRFSRKLAAFSVVCSLLAVLIVPAVMVSSSVLDSASVLTEKIESGAIDIPEANPAVKEWPFVGVQLHQVWVDAEQNLEATIQTYKSQIQKIVGFILGQVADLSFAILIFVFSIIISGFLVNASDNTGGLVKKFGYRFTGSSGDRFSELATVTIRNVMKGILGVAVIQSVLAAIGLYLLDFPGAPLLALGVLMLGVVQVSPGLILIPASIYSFNMVDTVPATIFLIWNILVGSIDNVLKPILMGRGTDTPMLVIFMGAIGGFISLGLIGLFIGAVTLVVGYELLMAWLTMGDEFESESEVKIDEAS